MKKLAFLTIIASLLVWSCGSKQADTSAATVHTQEHGGKAVGQEHAGQEHGGNAVGQEHAGQEHGGNAVEQEHAGQEHGGNAVGQEHAGQAAKNYSSAEIKAAMRAHIAERQQSGVFRIHDDKTGEDLQLKFVKIHDPVRKIEGRGYFACTDFEVVGQPGKLYDLDFWLNPEHGELEVTAEKIHKNPVKTANGWEKKARYTFINDNPVEIK